MTGSEQRELKDLLGPYLARSTAIAVPVFLTDVLIYLLAVAGTIWFEETALKLLCAVIAGFTISALFVIGHDAAHGAFTDSRRLNGLIGRIAFLPSLHNYSLWQIAHNRLHHSTPNLKGKNSWSPMSVDEYRSRPPWRRALERIYRSAAGFGLYYLIERWWKDKFFPRAGTGHLAAHWWDFALLIAFLALLSVATVGGALVLGHSHPAAALLWAFGLPFVIWNTSMGWTVYLQHTHQRIPWFRDEAQWSQLGGQEQVTPYIRFPRWFEFLFHDINEHTAHHLSPKIPCYRIRAAQLALARHMGDRLVSEPFSIGGQLTTLACCKLYDFERHRWLDFAGRPTAEVGFHRMAEAYT